MKQQEADKIIEWLQDQWGEGETLIDVLKDAKVYINSLVNECSICGGSGVDVTLGQVGSYICN